MSEVEVLEVRGLEKEVDEDGDIWWTAGRDVKSFSVLVKLNGRKREIRFRRDGSRGQEGEVRFFSDLVHKKFVDELADKLEELGLDVVGVWIRHEFCDIEVWGIIDDGRVWI